VDGDKFFDYIRGSLISNMLIFDGSNPRSTVIGQLFSSPCGTTFSKVKKNMMKYYRQLTIPCQSLKLPLTA